MQVKGIRILDKTNGAIGFELPDILEEVENGRTFYWSTLYLEGASGNLGEGQSIPYFEWQYQTYLIVS